MRDKTYVFQPSHLINRIVAQAGWFSVHKYLEDKGKFTLLDNHKTFKDKLRKYEIEIDSIPEIKDQIKAIGISKLMLFPNLDNL